MSDFVYLTTGKKNGDKPACRPDARGLFIVLEENPKKGNLSDDEYLQINLHAQRELCRQSPEFKKALKYWSRLPKNDDRQLGGFCVTVPKIEKDTAVAEWIHGFDDYDGLIYVFAITEEIDFRTGKTWKPVNVFSYNLSRGFETLDDIAKEHRMRYRMYFVFSEK